MLKPATVMPIYEYDCPKCGVIELSQRITAAALTKCPTCKRKVKRLISATSFALKGEGWYVTDYARKGNGKAKPEGSGGSEDASTKSDGAKPESKSEPGKSKPESSKTDAGSSSSSGTSSTSSGEKSTS